MRRTRGIRSFVRRSLRRRLSGAGRRLPRVKLSWRRPTIRRDRVPRLPHVEVEVRFRLNNEGAALAALRRAGVRFGRVEEQNDQAFAPAEWDYSQPRIGVTFARLRTVGDRHLFTVKRPLTDVRTCVEHECWVSDRGAMHKAILLMGFEPTIRIVKQRSLGHLRDWTFCLDEVEGLGRFVEIERLAAADEDPDQTRAEIDRFVAEIGLSAERCFDTYDALLYRSKAADDAVIAPVAVAA